MADGRKEGKHLSLKRREEEQKSRRR